jgi:ABC-type transport system substrate-binding protein
MLAFPPALSSSVFAASPQTTFTVGVVEGAPPSTWFQTPSNWGGENTITQIPYLYCYQFGAGGFAKPGICDVPHAVAGSNDQQWIVKLRSANFKWSDGVTINSTDLAYSFGVFLKHGPYANLSALDVWGNLRDKVDSISIVNSTAIQLTTNSPYPLFTMLTWLYQVYPYHFYKQFTGNNTLQTTSILGGPGDTPYVPQGFTAGSTSMTLVANPSSPSWNGTTPSFSRMIIEFFTSDQALVNAVAAGTVQAAAIAPSDVAALTSASGVKTDSVPSIYQMQFFVDPKGYPYNNTSFRQAVMYLLPKTQINQLLYNNQTSIGNQLLLPPQAYSTYWPGPSTPTFKYNPTEAAAKLTAAGLTKNSAGNWAMKNGTVLTVQMIATNNLPDVVRAAQQIQSSMEAAGLKVNLNLVDLTTGSNDKYNPPGNYKIILLPDEYFPSPFKWMRNPVNLPFDWSNSTFQSYFSQSLSNTDPAAALSELKQALNILAEEAVTNSILFVPSYVAFNTKGVSNWQPALSNAISSDVFVNPVLSVGMMTSVQPVSSTGSSSSTSSSASSSHSSSSTSSAAASGMSTNDLLLYGALAVIILIIVAAIALRMRGRKPAPSSAPSPAPAPS